MVNPVTSVNETSTLALEQSSTEFDAISSRVNSFGPGTIYASGFPPPSFSPPVFYHNVTSISDEELNARIDEWLGSDDVNFYGNKDIDDERERIQSEEVLGPLVYPTVEDSSAAVEVPSVIRVYGLAIPLITNATPVISTGEVGRPAHHESSREMNAMYAEEIMRELSVAETLNDDQPTLVDASENETLVCSDNERIFVGLSVADTLGEQLTNVNASEAEAESSEEYTSEHTGASGQLNMRQFLAKIPGLRTFFA